MKLFFKLMSLSIFAIGGLCGTFQNDVKKIQCANEIHLKRSDNKEGNMFDSIATVEQFKPIDCDDGYVISKIEIYKLPFTTASDLYLIQAKNSFTPGHAARVSNVKRPDGSDYKDYYLKKGYFHLYPYQYYMNENTKGGEIVPKAMRPLSSSVETTIASSFGGNFSFSSEYTDGIELGEGGKLTSSSSNKKGLTFSFENTISSVSDDPILSAQYNSTNLDMATWNYEAINHEISGKITYNLNAYYLFEMSKEHEACDRDAFNVYCEFSTTNIFKVMFWWKEGWKFDGKKTLSFFN